MTDDYTPTTAGVRAWYGADEFGYPAPEGQEVPEFDRWLAQHDAEVAAKAWDEGARHVYTEGGRCAFARDGDPCPYNPYRKEQN